MPQQINQEEQTLLELHLGKPASHLTACYLGLGTHGVSHHFGGTDYTRSSDGIQNLLSSGGKKMCILHVSWTWGKALGMPYPHLAGICKCRSKTHSTWPVLAAKLKGVTLPGVCLQHT